MSGPHAVTIRTATPADFPDIQRLNADLFKFEASLNDNSRNLDWPYTDYAINYFKKCCASQDSFIAFVAESNHIVGYLAASMYTKNWMTANPIAEIDNMFIESGHRTQGVGSGLMEAFKAWALSRGAQRLKVGALTANHPAISFYQRHGFKAIELYLEQPLA
jgi:GNAT superfamily N-acetyltransferase